MQKEIKSWEQLLDQYHMEPDLIYLVSDTYTDRENTKFRFHHIDQTLRRLPQLIENNTLIQLVNNLQLFNLKDIIYDKDLLYLRESITYLLNGYIICWKNSKQQKQLIIPKCLGLALVQINQKLGIKKMGMTTSLACSWQRTDKNKLLQNLTLQDIRMKYCFTKQQRYERLFFGTSVIASIILTKIIKLCYQIDYLINKNPQRQSIIQQKFRQIQKNWEKINKLMQQIINDLSPNFFYKILRPFTQGYQNIKFQAVHGLVTSSGGNGGYDPSFQIFQRYFSIQTDQNFKIVQQRFRNQGMSLNSRNFMKYISQTTLIRKYCSINPIISASYNKVLHSYSKFIKIHTYIIKKFILDFIPQQLHHKAQGTSGALISLLLSRAQHILSQKIQ